MRRRLPRSGPLLVLFVLLSLLLAACGSDSESESEASASDDAAESTDNEAEPASTEPVTLRLGMFPNVTHATGLVGVEAGLFEEALAENVTLEQSFFNAG